MTTDELARFRQELTDLSRDLAKGLQALTFLVSANRSAQDEVHERLNEMDRSSHAAESRVDARLTELEAAVDGLQHVPSRLAVLEKIVSRLGSGAEITAEDAALLRKGSGKTNVRESQWRLYVLLTLVAVPGVVALASKLLEMWAAP